MITKIPLDVVIEEALSIHESAFIMIRFWYHRIEEYALQGKVAETERGCEQISLRLATAHKEARVFLYERGLEDYYFIVMQDVAEQCYIVGKVIDDLIELAMSVSCTSKMEIQG